MILSKRSIRQLIFASFTLSFVSGGCSKGNADEEEPEVACSDSACFSQCQKSEWLGLESFWALSARCVEDGYDEAQCICDARCDDALCHAYCQETDGFLSGSCEFISCVCSNAPAPSGDAGDMDGGSGDSQDAGQ